MKSVTISGWIYDPQKMGRANINVYDIAWNLAHLCRYHGATKWMYSVAQHSRLLAGKVWTDTGNASMALYALLHDAAEAYIGDLPATVKPNKSYDEIERAIMDDVMVKFGLNDRLTGEQIALVQMYDLRIRADEMKALCHPSAMLFFEHEPLNVDIEVWSFEVARLRFVDFFNEMSIEAGIVCYAA